MLIKTEIADLNTPTGVMRTYIHRPAHDKKSQQFYSTLKFFNKPARLSALPDS